MGKMTSSGAMEDGREHIPDVGKQSMGFKIRKWPMFFACLALFSFIATVALSFMAAASYPVFFWVPFVGLTVFLASLILLRASVFRHNSQHAQRSAPQRVAGVVLPEAGPVDGKTSQEVFDAEDVVAASPFTIEQLREVALTVAAEDEKTTENAEWTPINLPKPLYAATPKAQRRPTVEVLEKTDYTTETTTIKQALTKINEAPYSASDGSEQSGNENPTSTKTESADAERKKERLEEPITNLDDVLQRRRAF